MDITLLGLFLHNVVLYLHSVSAFLTSLGMQAEETWKHIVDITSLPKQTFEQHSQPPPHLYVQLVPNRPHIHLGTPPVHTKPQLLTFHDQAMVATK
jgi:hypothetical protein